MNRGKTVKLGRRLVSGKLQCTVSGTQKVTGEEGGKTRGRAGGTSSEHLRASTDLGLNWGAEGQSGEEGIPEPIYLGTWHGPLQFRVLGLCLTALRLSPQQ